jgi:hypothetical protein
MVNALHQGGMGTMIIVLNTSDGWMDFAEEWANVRLLCMTCREPLLAHYEDDNDNVLYVQSCTECKRINNEKMS